MKRNLIIALLILAVVALSCNSISVPIQAIQPTYTLYPTQVPPTAVPPTAIPARAEIDSILINNGYTRYADGDQYCDYKCKSYLYPSQGLLAQAYPDGLTLGVTLSDKYDATTSGKIIGYVMQQAFGDEVRLWVADHLPSALDTDQNGYVDGYQIAITVSFEGKSPLVIIVIKAVAGAQL